MRRSRILQLSLVLAGALCVASSGCGRSRNTAAPNDSSAGMGSGGAIASGGVAGAAPGGTVGSGGTAAAAAGGTLSGGASAIGGSVGVGGAVTTGMGGIGSGGSDGTLPGMGGSAKGGSIGSGGISTEPIADGGMDSDGPDPLVAALSEKTLTYWATSEQKRPDGGMLSRNPSDQDFVAIAPVAEDVLVFSTDASTVQMTAIQRDGGVPLGVPWTGTRTATDQGKWSYQLAPATGGRLVVWLSGTTILASKILYGSGVPVTESTRGELRGN